ncbi:MAG: ferrochelatase [Candidatus Dactylopiibacterium carminicum]|uniref:Ferrochelatase n=1 Tax=Candidatus Dactylopiibacterium carminicum TaxID=857335 RepID=A0A272EPE3_9RHOO|nr:ferrochelatase [Candidatus Dactylopiibacterium carminicum]KAF7599129.1 ferrochelatase [Candidatus Dactylopiibacterium carminicum]PAS91984.1 MAG: ferrochelatase [Candidatus Dactylopiibacterium carminicum]PAS95252.1 MAG: ferrochelatase [Candidatus Dactylopiibacterium carminicum]PAS99147.1 MAG: ferrochelatase [Candidatus Dactylopiibacterium carminicum]
MPSFLPEPQHSQDNPARIGVLLVNLGTPEAPTPAAVRRYLRQFLSDPRVIEIPRLLWWPILNGIILPFRSRASAAKYASIWLKEGSPLRHYTELQTKLLRGYFTAAGQADIQVEYAMRYGEPAVQSALMRLKAAHCTRVLVLPLYPQYAGSTTGSVCDAVAQAMLCIRNLPELRIVRSFPGHPAYIQALAASVRRAWAQDGEPERLVMSFHGLPRATIERGDPYHRECLQTGRLLAEALGLDETRYLVTFQSRFGRTEWLQPYTEPSLVALARQGVSRVDVICPGFVSDCIETLEEIALEAKTAFLNAGGKSFHYLPCLNGDDGFIRLLRELANSHMQDWLVSP